MNYHKKIQNIGFKRTTPTVLSKYDRYVDMVEGKTILTLSTFIEKAEKENSLTAYRNYFKSKDRFNIHHFDISATKDELQKLQTYIWKVSDTFTMYISIFNNRYICFANDISIVRYIDEYYSKMEVDDSVFIIHKDNLNPNFWINIKEKLNINHKREIVIREII